MKFIFSFLFSVLLISPVFAECNSTTSENDCTCAGWEFNGVECGQCARYEYSPEGDPVCHPCAAQNSDNTWTWSITPPTPNSIFDYDNASNGQSECPWKCANRYYKNNTGDSCTECTPNSSTPDFPNGGATDISACKCNAGYYMGGAGNNECEPCPSNSANCQSSGASGLSYDTVTCNNGYVPVIANDNTVTCQQCPPNTAPNNNGQCECQITGAVITPTTYGVTCECGYNSQLSSDNTQCVCDSNGPYPNTSVEDSVVHCTACGNDATYIQVESGPNPSDNVYACRCNADYYGNGQTCTRCPPGTRKNADVYASNGSPSTISACAISSATKFCTGSGDNKVCMQLIPSDATITQPSSN